MVNFRIDVVVDPKQAQAGAKQVESSLAGVEARANALRTALRRAFALLGGVALGVRAVRTLAQFQEAIATAGAVSGASAEQFARLSDEAQRLGITTRFTATQAADALTNLARAGFSVDEALEAADDTLNLAVAGGLDLASAADITASALRGFRLEADQATRVTDVLTLTANSANTTVNQLGEGLKFVAPVAAGLGQSLELTNAALGALSDAGLKATLAGTGLRRVLATLEAPASAQVQILRQLGVEADEVRVSQVGLIGALERLRAAGIDTGQALELFGQRGGPAFEVLVNQIPRIRRLAGELDNAAGTAAETAAKIDATLLGSLRRVQSAFDGLILSVGDAGAAGALTGLFESLASVLRFAAANADTLVVAVEALAAALLFRAVPAIASTIVGMKGLAVAASANPFLALGVAITTVTLVALNKLKQESEEIAATLNRIEADAGFANLGASIRRAQQEINNINRAIEAQQKRGFGASESQLARLAQLEQVIKGTRVEIQKQAEDTAKLKAVQDAQLPTVDNLINKLERQAQLLRENARETEIQVQLQQELDRLLQQGTIPTEEDEKAIEAKLRLIQQLKDQRDALEEIRGPQETLARREAALNALLEQGRITADEFTSAIRALRGEFEEAAGGPDPFAERVRNLEEANLLLQTQINAGQQAAELTRIELDLNRQGIELNDEQRGQLVGLVLLNQELTEEIRARAEAEREAARAAAEQERLISQLDSGARIAEQQQRLNDILKVRPDLYEEVARASEELTLRELDASTKLEDGFTRSFIRIKQEAEDLATVAERVVNVFADRATDALVEFARTGQFSFKEFANAILQDLTRIIARLLIVQALNAAIGALGGGTGGAAGAAAGAATSFGGGRQHGGTVQPGRSFVVGEGAGPELFIPDRTGTIVPNPGDVQQAPPVNNIQVINVDDPSMVPAAISEGAADDAIVNVLRRNSQKVNRVLGNS